MNSILESRLVLALLVFCASVRADDSIATPETWSFPQVIEAARAINPNNIEGKPFGRFGLAYPQEELEDLKISALPATELQKYADIVTHAYPDAVAMKMPSSCENLPVEKLNETAIAGIAYISINARNESARNWAAQCFASIQDNLRKIGK